MRRMGIGLGVGINRSNYAQGIFGAYATRVVADGGITEAGQCVDAVTGLLLNASLLLIPSGYKGGKLYAEIPTNGNGDLTWTRGSDAFRTNASGLIQRVPWNLLQRSEEFDNAVWTKSATTLTTNTTVAPNGTTTADTLIENTANSSHQIFQSITNVNGATPYTAMIYVKENASRNVAIRIQDGAFTYGQVVVTYNLNTGALISQVATGNAVIVSTSATLTNGYYLIAVSFTINLSTSFRYDVLMVNGTSNSYTGDGTSSIVIWGAQLVEGTTAQTYLPTTDRLNFPRLSYMYGSCPAVLLEPQRTNLALRSQEFDNASWSKSNLIVSENTTTSPDGTTNADTITIQSTGGGNNIRQNITVTANTTYTFSFYALRGTATELRYSVYNFSTPSDIVPITSYYSQTNTSTWSRISVTFTTPTGCTSIGIYPIRDTTSTGTVFFYGAQLEAGAYPTTYIPTTSATATRVADSFSRSNIYTNGLITASGGTWFVELRNNISYVRDSASRIGIGDTTGLITNSLVLNPQFGGGRALVLKYVAGVESILYSTTTSTVKIAIKWNGTSCDVFANGTKVASASAFTTTIMENLIGSAGVPYFIQQMALYPSPLSDTDCTTLTTL